MYVFSMTSSNFAMLLRPQLLRGSKVDMPAVFSVITTAVSSEIASKSKKISKQSKNASI